MSNAVFRVDRSWIQNSRPSMILDVRARVLAAEELLVSKLFVMRRERFDGADIAHIVYGSQGKLDWDRVLALVSEHWEILLFALVLYRYVYPAYSHYVPSWVWQRLLVRFSNDLTNPDPAAEFRGSLVDDKMFAIDVAEWGMADALRVHRSEAKVIQSKPPVLRITPENKRRKRHENWRYSRSALLCAEVRADPGATRPGAGPGRLAGRCRRPHQLWQAAGDGATFEFSRPSSPSPRGGPGESRL